MKSKTRRRIEMGRRALAFSEDHPDESPGYATAVSHLRERLARADELIALQQSGLAQVGGASEQKWDLRQLMVRAQLRYIVGVAELAAREVPGLMKSFESPRERIPYLEFQSAAHALFTAALDHRELLVKHGLADTLLRDLARNLESFDRAMEHKIDARQAHVGATAELDATGREIVRLVRVMEWLNRSRFRRAPELLAGWKSASNVIHLASDAAEEAPTPEARASVAHESGSNEPAHT